MAELSVWVEFLMRLWEKEKPKMLEDWEKQAIGLECWMRDNRRCVCRRSAKCAFCMMDEGTL